MKPKTVKVLRGSIIFTVVNKKPLRRADPKHYLSSHVVVNDQWPRRGFWTDDEMAEMSRS